MSGITPQRRPPPTRIERQAQIWIRRMDSDPERHAPGLDRWIGDSVERLDAYNKLAVAMRMSTHSAGLHYETRDLGVNRKPARFTLGWTIAAIVMGVAAAAMGFVRLAPWAELLGRAAAPIEAFETSDGVARQIRLADGSEVVLQPNSSIKVQLARDVRAIRLERGEAEFHVAHASSWPFVVQAGGGSVTARGTIFEVALTNEVAVKLLEGKIDVALPATAGNHTPVVRHLVAGQSTHFVAASPRSVLASPSAPTTASQGDGMKSFDDVTVGDVVKETNRTSTRKIEIADPAIAVRKVVLQLHAGDAQDVADGLAAYLDLVVDDSQPDLLVLRRKN